MQKPTPESVIAEEPQDPSLPTYASSVGSRVLKGLGAKLLDQGITLASRILLVPLFLNAWGVEVYGEWLILTSFVAYLSLSEFGGQLYVVNTLTQAYARRDYRLFQRAFNTALIIFILVPGAVFLLFIAALMVTPLTSILDLHRTASWTAMLVLSLLGLQVACSIPQGLILGTYRAIGLLPRGVMYGNVLQALQLVITALVLWLGGGMVLVASFFLLPFILIVGMIIPDLKAHLPQEVKFFLADLDTGLARTFIRPSFHFFSIQLASTLSVQGPVLIVGMLLGAVQVVVFSTIRTMAHILKQLLGLIAHTVWPEMTRLDAEGNSDKLIKLFQVMLRVTMVVTVIIIIGFHYWGEQVYRFWIGNRVEFNQQILDLFLLYVFQAVFWTACANVLMAINRHYRLSKVLAISAVVSLGLAALGGQLAGVQGVVAGILIGELLFPCWCVPYLLFQYHHDFSLKFHLKELAPVIVTLAGAFWSFWTVIILFPLLCAWCLEALPRPILYSEIVNKKRRIVGEKI